MTTLGGLLWLLANVCGKTCTIYNSALFYASTRQLEIPPSVIPSGPPDIPTVTGNQLNKQVDLLSYHHCLYLYLSDTSPPPPPHHLTLLLCCKQGGDSLPHAIKATFKTLLKSATFFIMIQSKYFLNQYSTEYNSEYVQCKKNKAINSRRNSFIHQPPMHWKTDPYQ